MNQESELRYEGTLALQDGFRVIVISVAMIDRCFPVEPQGRPLARTGFPSIDRAKAFVQQRRSAGSLAMDDRLPPSALPPEQRLPLEPLMDVVMRVEIRGIYVVLLGILLGGEPGMWILELPLKAGVRTTRIFFDEAEAVAAYEALCVELSTKFIDTYLPDADDIDKRMD